MSSTPSSEFLSGQGIPVGLHEIETELARLWGPAAAREGGPELEHPTVTRIVLANLVVAHWGAEPRTISGWIESVVARYPCRAIILDPTDRPDRKVSAEVSAVCHLPAPGMPQVCAERIVLQAGPTARDLLPGAVLPLLEPDLPVVLWWNGDPSRAPELFHALADAASRVILDLPDPANVSLATALGLGVNRHTRDLVWFGNTPWREIAAQFFDPPGAANALGSIASVRIDAVSPTAGRPPRVAAWFAAWLGGQLGWKGLRCHAADEGLTASFESASGPVSVAIQTRIDAAVPLPALSGFELKSHDGAAFRAARVDGRGDDIRIEVEGKSCCPLPRRVRSPEWDKARRLAAAFESARDDPPYRDALPHVLWLLTP